MYCLPLPGDNFGFLHNTADIPGGVVDVPGKAAGGGRNRRSAVPLRLDDRTRTVAAVQILHVLPSRNGGPGENRVEAAVGGPEVRYLPIVVLYQNPLRPPFGYYALAGLQIGLIPSSMNAVRGAGGGGRG